MTNDRAISAEDPPNPDAHSDVRLGQQWAQQLALPDGHAPGPQAFRWGVCVCASKTPQDAQWFVGSWLRSFGSGARAMGMFGEEEPAPSWSSGEGCPVPAVVALEVLEQRAVRWAPGGAEPGGGVGSPARSSHASVSASQRAELPPLWLRLGDRELKGPSRSSRLPVTAPCSESSPGTERASLHQGVCWWGSPLRTPEPEKRGAGLYPVVRAVGEVRGGESRSAGLACSPAADFTPPTAFEGPRTCGHWALPVGQPGAPGAVC